MTPDEKQFNDRKAKIDAFKAELKALVEKYDLKLHTSDSFDGEENYIGSDLYFVVDGETWYGETVERIFEAAIN